jgi:hypothetical protein
MAERYDPLTEYLKDKAAAEAKAKAERERLEAVALLKASIPYSREMVTEICDLIAEGATLKDVCAREHTPTHKIVRRWFKERPEFAQAFAEAERERLRSWEDQLIEVARDDSRDHVVKDNGDGPQKIPNAAAVSRSKLHVETIARRLRAEWPDKYGDMVLLKPAEPNVGEQLASMPLGDIERMAENARAVEQDCEIREMIDAKALLKQLNRDRSKRGEPQLTLKDYLARRER